jgi:hypothetical protein
MTLSSWNNYFECSCDGLQELTSRRARRMFICFCYYCKILICRGKNSQQALGWVAWGWLLGRRLIKYNQS